MVDRRTEQLVDGILAKSDRLCWKADRFGQLYITGLSSEQPRDAISLQVERPGARAGEGR